MPRFDFLAECKADAEDPLDCDGDDGLSTEDEQEQHPTDVAFASDSDSDDGNLSDFGDVPPSWADHLAILESNAAPVDFDVDDDVAREEHFEAATLRSVETGVRIFRKLRIPYKRPPDFYCPMLKTDQHMHRIKVLQQKAAAKAKESAEVRKQKTQRKFGKQVQATIEQERAKKKKESVAKVEAVRKARLARKTKRGDDNEEFDIALDDEALPPTKKQARPEAARRFAAASKRLPMKSKTGGPKGKKSRRPVGQRKR